MTAELCWSRALAAALGFSKQFPDLALGMRRGLERLGALPEKLVWAREGHHSRGAGRQTAEYAALVDSIAAPSASTPVRLTHYIGDPEKAASPTSGVALPVSLPRR
ncbi:MAG TPA: hypothetical protein VGV57_04465 [Thermoleophilaceae bacterium]|nr:hypothetical protein [Thermoleophilaceae bacterium]